MQYQIFYKGAYKCTAYLNDASEARSVLLRKMVLVFAEDVSVRVCR